jgi:hypothetical protein
MAISSVRWLRGILIKIAIVSALALPVVFPGAMKAVTTVVAARIHALPTFSTDAIVVEIAFAATIAALAASARWRRGADRRRRGVSTIYSAATSIPRLAH